MFAFLTVSVEELDASGAGNAHTREGVAQRLNDCECLSNLML
jgi:hypothetical protein